MIWNNENDTFVKLGLHALYNWQEWFMAQGSNNREQNQVQLRWSPLTVGRLKCNIDVGFNVSWGTTNKRWCVRDNLRNFVIGRAAWDFGSHSILEAEVLALKKAI